MQTGKIIVSENEKVVCLVIATSGGERIAISKNTDLQRIGEIEVARCIFNLASESLIEYKFEGDSFTAKLLVDFAKIDVNRSQAAVLERQFQESENTQCSKLLWYVTPVTQLIDVTNYDFGQLRELVSKNTFWATQKLSSLSYPEYLKTPFWLILSYRVKKDAAFRCAACNSPENLQAHHREYPQRGTEILNHTLILTCFCERCHNIFHEAKKDTHVLENSNH